MISKNEKDKKSMREANKKYIAGFSMRKMVKNKINEINKREREQAAEWLRLFNIRNTSEQDDYEEKYSN